MNLTVPFLLIKAALPHLRKVRGSIVNIGSIEALGSNPTQRLTMPGGAHTLCHQLASRV